MHWKRPHRTHCPDLCTKAQVDVFIQCHGIEPQRNYYCIPLFKNRAEQHLQHCADVKPHVQYAQVSQQAIQQFTWRTMHLANCFTFLERRGQKENTAALLATVLTFCEPVILEKGNTPMATTCMKEPKSICACSCFKWHALQLVLVEDHEDNIHLSFVHWPNNSDANFDAKKCRSLHPHKDWLLSLVAANHSPELCLLYYITAVLTGKCLVWCLSFVKKQKNLFQGSNRVTYQMLVFQT